MLLISPIPFENSCILGSQNGIGRNHKLGLTVKLKLDLNVKNDLKDNHSLMRLHNRKPEIWTIQRISGFPTYIDNKEVIEQSPEQKRSPPNRQKMLFLLKCF